MAGLGCCCWFYEKEENNEGREGKGKYTCIYIGGWKITIDALIT